MALQEQNISFKFAGGIETKMDSKAVPAVRLLDLENGIFAKAITIQKRNGYSAKSMTIDGSASTISGAKRLARRDDELLLFTDNRCYSKQSGTDQWTDVGACLCPIGNERPAVATSSEQTVPDHATNNGVTAYAWEDSRGGVWWTTVDSTTGAIYRAPTQASATGQRPRCVAVGDAIHIYYAVTASQAVMAIVVNPSSPAADVTPIILVSDLDTTNPVFDACPTTRDGTPALIAWHEHATTDIRVGYVTASGVLGAPGNGHPSVYRITATMLGSSPIACAFKYSDGSTADRIFVAWMTTTPTGVVRTLDGGTVADGIGATVAASDTAYAVPTLVKRIALAAADAYVWAAFEENAAQASQRYTVVNSVAIDGAAGTESTLRSVGLATRAFQAGDVDDVFAVFVHDTTYFNVYMTLRLSDFAPAGRHAVAEASGAPGRTHLASVHVSSDIARFVLPVKARLASDSNDQFTEKNLRLFTLDFDNEDAHRTAQLGRSLYMGAGCPQAYDGRQWSEQGFHMGPEYITTVNGASGSLTASSTYLYRVWYEWTDAQGEIHRGPMSIGTEVVLGGGEDEVTLTLPTLRVTRKTNVRICVARSLPGETSRLWRVSSLDPTTSGATANGYLANTTSADTVSFVDRMSDTDLQLQERVYTTGGIVSNDMPTLGSLVAVGKSRLFWNDALYGSVVRFSKRIATGYGVECAPEFAHDIDPGGGDITALWVMDDVVVVFKQAAIYIFNGEGPLENGSTALGGFSSAKRVPGDVGCTDPASIVEYAEGLAFKSAKGIYRLGRDFSLEYIGAPVETYNDQDVRRATVMPDRTQIVFLTSSGSTLLYDYLFGQWSRFSNHEGYDAEVVSNSYHYLRTDDAVWVETPGSFSDAGNRITLRIETAWLHLHEHLQGFQRFWKALLLGTWVSAHQLGYQYRLDYNEAWSDPSWIDATNDTSSTGWLTGEGCAEIGVDPIGGTVYGEGAYGDGPYGGTGPDVYQWRFGIHEAGQSIQLRFEDFEKSGLTGASFELTELTIIGGVKAPDLRPFSGARSI